MLPVYVMYDSGVDLFERDCITDALQEFVETFPQRKVVIYGTRAWSTGDYSSADWYVRNAKRVIRKGWDWVQYDAQSLLELMMKEPWQKANPHIDVLFTSHDLTGTSRGTVLNFCFGMTLGRFTVQCVFRFRDLPATDRRLAIKAVVWHELGHVFGCAANPHRSNTEYKLGRHCTNPGCIMRQGVNLNEWVRHARDAYRLGRIYCPQCREDLLRSRD